MRHLRPRTIVIFSVFILVAMGYTIFIFNYRAVADRLLSRYGVDCATVSNELSCLANNKCEPIYDQTCPTCSTAQFVRCQDVTPVIARQVSEYRTQCEATQGVWYENKLGQFCLCQANGANRTFVSGQGCVAAQ